MDQNKKIEIMLGILLALLILNLLQMSWVFGKNSVFKDQLSVVRSVISAQSSTAKGNSSDKPMRLFKKLPSPKQDSNLRRSGQYYGNIYSEVVQICKETCSIQCTTNGKNSLAQSICEKGCEDYYAKKSDQKSKEGLRALHTACKK